MFGAMRRNRTGKHVKTRASKEIPSVAEVAGSEQQDVSCKHSRSKPPSLRAVQILQMK